MACALVLTVIGKDRPGLVEVLANLIATHQGNWEESRMARLAGHFAGVVQIHLPEEQAQSFMAALPMLTDQGLSVSVVDSDWNLGEIDHRHAWQLELVGQDRPGIVRQISSILASQGVSVQDLRTVVESTAMSGERMFRAEAELVLSDPARFDQIRTALEQLSDDIMIDITLTPSE